MFNILYFYDILESIVIFYEGDYRIIVLPDTQNIIERFPHIYLNMMKWIKNNKDSLNIKTFE